MQKCALTSCKRARTRYIASARVYDSCARICVQIFTLVSQIWRYFPNLWAGKAGWQHDCCERGTHDVPAPPHHRQQLREVGHGRVGRGVEGCVVQVLCQAAPGGQAEREKVEGGGDEEGGGEGQDEGAWLQHR